MVVTRDVSVVCVRGGLARVRRSDGVRRRRRIAHPVRRALGRGPLLPLAEVESFVIETGLTDRLEAPATNRQAAGVGEPRVAGLGPAPAAPPLTHPSGELVAMVAQFVEEFVGWADRTADLTVGA